MTRALLVVVALIVYGSLYPFQFRPLTPALPVFEWPARFGAAEVGDIAVNLFIYLPVGMFGFLALDRRGAGWPRWVAPVALAFLLSAGMESIQIFDRNRVSSLLDVTCNTLGGLAGVILGWAVRKSITGAMLLVFYWLGYQICVLFGIATGLRKLPHPSPLELTSTVLAWVAVVWMLSTEKAAGPRAWRIAFGCVFAALPIVRGLSPFHWTDPAQPFLWTPFEAMFSVAWIAGLPVFLEKSFYYGAAIWLLRAAGLRFGASITLVAIGLSIVEVLQRHLPGRTAEITDPLMALIGGYLLWQTESAGQIQRFGTISVRR